MNVENIKISAFYFFSLIALVLMAVFAYYVRYQLTVSQTPGQMKTKTHLL